MTAYVEFTRRLVERFDRKDPEEHFVELTKLKQTGNMETYISEFLKLSVMVPDLSVAMRVYMIIDELAEPFRGLVRSTRTTMLQDTVGRTRDLQDAMLRSHAFFITSLSWLLHLASYRTGYI